MPGILEDGGAESLQEGQEVTLKGHKAGVGNEHRIACLTAILDQAESKVNHIDTLRQKNLTTTLLIFAGLFGFGLRCGKTVNPVFVSGALTLLMIILCWLNWNLHKFSHGWRATREHLVQRLAEVVNNPESDVSFHTYYRSAEGEAEKLGWQVLHYLLIAGGASSYYMFCWGT